MSYSIDNTLKLLHLARKEEGDAKVWKNLAKFMKFNKCWHEFCLNKAEIHRINAHTYSSIALAQHERHLDEVKKHFGLAK